MNIPNILSIIRLVFVPVFCVVYFSGVENAQFYAAGIYAVASLTDVLDGWLARRLNMITRLGRVLDPMADKLMTFTVLLCIVIKGLIPWWAVAVYFVKEALLSIGALVQYKKIDDVPHSHLIGKFSTVFFFGTCLVIMLFPEIPKPAASALIAAALTFTLTAFFFYLHKFIVLTRKNKT